MPVSGISGSVAKPRPREEAPEGLGCRQLRCEARKALSVAVRPSILYAEVLALNITA
jgi:hypothetical protein